MCETIGGTECSYSASESLIWTLRLPQRQAEAVDKMLRLSERVEGSSKGPQLLIEAARTAAIKP